MFPVKGKRKRRRVLKEIEHSNTYDYVSILAMEKMSGNKSI